MQIKTLLAVWAGLTALALAHLAEAQSAPSQKVGSNIRLGDDPSLLPEGQRAQAGPHIARSYSDPNLLVATFQEGRFRDGAALACGYAVSTDGGKSWTRQLIPGWTELDGGTAARASHPMTAIDRHGTIYLVGEVLQTFPQGPGQAMMSISRDQGKTAGPPFIGFTGTSDNKNWLAINTFAQSDTVDRLAFAFGAIDERLHLISRDQAETNWTTAQFVGTAVSYWACQPVFLPDGTLANVGFRYPDGWSGIDSPGQIECVVSTDGGRTFAAPVVIMNLTGRIYVDPVARTGGDYVSVAADRLAGILYLTIQAASAQDGRPEILFTRSIDKGRSWSAPVRVNDTPNREAVFNPAIAVSPDGQHVTISFYDKRHQTAVSDGTLVDLYLAESFDAGQTWEPNLRLSESSSDLSLAPLTSDGYMFGDYQGIVPALNFETPGVAVWIDTRAGDPDPYAVTIARTKGATFETWRKLRFAATALEDVAVSGENADPDGDHLPNLIEYALGLEPRHPDRNPFVVEVDRTSTTVGEFVVSYDCLAVVGDVEFEWQTSTNLVDWSSATAGASLGNSTAAVPDDPSKHRRSHRFTKAAPTTFVRLGARRRNG